MANTLIPSATCATLDSFQTYRLKQQQMEREKKCDIASEWNWMERNKLMRAEWKFHDWWMGTCFRHRSYFNQDSNQIQTNSDHKYINRSTHVYWLCCAHTARHRSLMPPPIRSNSAVNTSLNIKSHVHIDEIKADVRNYGQMFNSD